MTRRGVPVAMALVLLVSGLSATLISASNQTAPGALAAQESAAPPPPMFGLGLPAGIDVAPLAGGTTTALPPAPTQLVLERVTVQPGDSEDLQQTVGPEALVVESGSVTVVDDLGLEAVYPVGGQRPDRHGDVLRPAQ